MTIMSTILAVAIIGANPVTVAAGTSAKINAKEFKSVESFRFIETDGTDMYSDIGDDLPEKVDLRERGVVTPVKLQNPFGTCWAFGAIAASETSILSEMGQTYEQTQMDLSEKHLAWFIANPLKDEYSAQNGEGICQYEEMSSASFYKSGGLRFYASSMFSQGVGPATEEEYPYKGKKGLINRYVNSDGDLVDYCYSDKDDWSIDLSKRFERKYKLEDSIILGGIVYQDEEGIKYDERILQAVKEQINMGRAVAVGYCADVSLPNEEGNTEYMNQQEWCQYTDEINYANHEVCIIGYDDNYPKENFNEAHQPPENGAFLVKNSWGSEENEFPNKGSEWGIVENGKHTGYFWLSYYDMTIEDFEIFDFDINYDSSEVEIIDQYDFASYNGANTVESPKECEMVNVFTAQYNQELREVSCITSTPGTQAYYEVYLLEDGSDGTEYSALAASETEVYQYGGYHLKTLSTPVKLTKGQRYSIHVKLVNEDNYNEIIIPVLGTNKENPLDGYNFYTKTIVNEGESLLKYNGKWYDWTDIRDAFNPYYTSYDADNFPIKGYSVLTDGTDISGKTIKLSKDSYKYDGKAKKPTVTIDGLTQEKDYTVEYSNNVKAGKATVTITGTGVYTGTITKEFVITTEAPAKVTAKLATAGSIKVTWAKKSAADIYKVTYQKTGGKIVSKTTKDTSITLKNLSKGDKYTIKVSAGIKCDGTTYYGKTTTVSATTLKKVPIKSVVKKSAGKVKVSFTNVPGETGYQISRAAKKTGTKIVATFASTKATSKVVAAKKGTKYYYKVRAYKTVDGKKTFGAWSEAKAYTCE